MKRIDRKYAIIYVDDTGETLNTDDFVTDDMISDYYKDSGFLQWNYYVIIPEDLVPNDEIIKLIENNDKYARKIIVKRDKIKSFLERAFPKLRQSMGEIGLVEGENWGEARDNCDLYLEDHPKAFPVPSFSRNYSDFGTLTKLDNLRAKIIKKPDSNYVFYTHIKHEMSLAKKKFKLLTTNKDDN